MDIKKIFLENFKFIYLGAIFLISVIVGTYIYTENSGYKGCLNTWAKSHGYRNYQDYAKQFEYGPGGTTVYNVRKFCEYAKN